VVATAESTAAAWGGVAAAESATVVGAEAEPSAMAGGEAVTRAREGTHSSASCTIATMLSAPASLLIAKSLNDAATA
jgi:hypothetical protein